MKIAWLTALLCALSFTGLAATPTADQVLSEAQAKAARENKTVFLYFGASWCPWCKRLEAWLERPEVKRVLQKHVIPVKLVIREKEDQQVLNNPGADTVLKRLGGEGAGIPFLALLDRRGDLIVSSMRPVAEGRSENVAFPNNPEGIAWFISMLKKAAPGIPREDLNVLESSLKPAK